MLWHMGWTRTNLINVSYKWTISEVMTIKKLLICINLMDYLMETAINNAKKEKRRKDARRKEKQLYLRYLYDPRYWSILILYNLQCIYANSTLAREGSIIFCTLQIGNRDLISESL